jgi:predicted nucleotidyltransferase component of viral defense system
MIPQYAISEHSEFLPWKTSAMVEQDLIICRALIAIYNNEYLAQHLAFRGGTALHKLYLHPQSRYSEDIDLVQIQAEPIKETIIGIREVLSFLGEPRIKQKAHNNTLIFRGESEVPPVIPLRFKVEINCREHFNVLGWKKHDFSVKNQWFSGDCKITTYNLEELLGTKLRALYQRRKGRDLFDLWKAISMQNIDYRKMFYCYHEYIKFVVNNPPSQKEFLQNMNCKIADEEFIGDTAMLLRPNEQYNVNEAWEFVKKQLIENFA